MLDRQSSKSSIPEQEHSRDFRLRNAHKSPLDPKKVWSSAEEAQKHGGSKHRSMASQTDRLTKVRMAPRAHRSGVWGSSLLPYRSRPGGRQPRGLHRILADEPPLPLSACAFSVCCPGCRLLVQGAAKFHRPKTLRPSDADLQGALSVAQNGPLAAISRGAVRSGLGPRDSKTHACLLS